MRQKVAQMLKIHAWVHGQSYRRVKREWKKLPRNVRDNARDELLRRMLEVPNA